MNVVFGYGADAVEIKYEGQPQGIVIPVQVFDNFVRDYLKHRRDGYVGEKKVDNTPMFDDGLTEAEF